jgi:O-antigen ligase
MQNLLDRREMGQRNTTYILLPMLLFVLVQAFWWRGRAAQNYAALDARVLVQVGLVLLLVPALVGDGLLQEVLRLLHGKSANWFVGIYVLGVVSTLWSANRMYSCYRAFECVVLIIAAFALLQAYGRFLEAEKKVLLALLGLGFLGVAHTASSQGISLSPGAWHSVLNGSLGAMVLSYCLAERASSRTFTPSDKRRFLTCALLGFFLVALSSSSGTNVALVIGLGVVVFLSERRGLKILYLLGCLAAGLGFLMLGGTEFLQSVVFPGKSAEAIATGHGRNVIWTLYFERIMERPWLGWGFAVLPRVVEEFYATSSHNSIIGITGGMGVAGLLLLVLFIVTYTRELGRAIRLGLPGARGCFAASVVAFVNSQSNGSFGEQVSMNSIGIFLLLGFSTLFVAARQESPLGPRGDSPGLVCYRNALPLERRGAFRPLVGKVQAVSRP